MVRTPVMALPRSSGFALLTPATKPKLDPARIFTLSGTLAFNLLLFGLLLTPMTIPPTALQDSVSHNPVIRDILKPPKPVIVDIVPITHPRPTPSNPVPVQVSTHRDPNPQANPPVISESGTLPTTNTASTDSNASLETPANVTGAPVPLQLAYRQAPAPSYPRAALLHNLSGTVLLQVLVDENGHPLDVTVARSSGHRELDEAARLQVLKRWSFQPATRNGRAVQALGLVPIEFNLQR